MSYKAHNRVAHTQRVSTLPLNPKLSVTSPLLGLGWHLSQLHSVIGGAGQRERAAWDGSQELITPLELLFPACSPALQGKRQSRQEAAELALDQRAGTCQLLPKSLSRAWCAHCKSNSSKSRHEVLFKITIDYQTVPQQDFSLTCPKEKDQVSVQLSPLHQDKTMTFFLPSPNICYYHKVSGVCQLEHLTAFLFVTPKFSIVPCWTFLPE